jgi:TonB family protein
MIRRLALPTLLVLATAPGVAFAQTEGARQDAPPPLPAKKPQLTRAPALVEGAPPEYPPAALAAGTTADVTVKIHIDATGAVTKVDVVTPVGSGFDEAAVAAAMKYRFSPAEFGGHPGAITVETTIHFTIQQVPAEPTPAEPPEPSNAPDAAPAPPAHAGAIHGTVKERGTRRALSGVTLVVQVAGAERETLSDARGDFRFEGLPAGNYQVIAVLSGYDRYEAGLGVYADEATGATLYLRPAGGNPYETVVEGEKDRLEVTRRTVTRRQMTTVPGTFGDPLRVIQNLPGMARAPYVLGLLLVRGSGPDDSGVYVDGHEIPLLYHFLGGPSILNPEFLETIDLYPGGFPARFGGHIGGIVDVSTRSTRSDGIHGSAAVDLLNSSLYLRAPIVKGVNVAIAARRSYIDALLPFFLPEPDPGSSLVVTPVYWDYQARVDVELPRHDSLSFMFFGSDDKLNVLQSDAEQTLDLGTHIGFNRVRATYTTHLGARSQYTLTLSPSYGEDVVGFNGGDYTSADATQTVFGLRERVHGDVNSWMKLDLGVDSEYRINHYKVKLPVATDLPGGGAGEIDIPPEAYERNIDEYRLGTWLELAMDVGRGVRLVPGLRFDTFLLAGEPRFSLDPRLVGKWQADAKTTYKAYAGTFHQAPQAEGFDASFGNPDLQLEYAIHTGVGVERKLTDVLSLETEAYYVDRRDQSTRVDTIVHNPDGTLRRLNFDSVQIGHTYGLEVLVRHEITRHFFGWLSYTLSFSEQRRHPGDEWELTGFDQTHNLTLVGSYHFDSGWEVGTRFRAVSGRPFTPIVGGTFDADAGAYVPVTGDRRSARTPFFHQLDFRGEKTWTFDTWSFSAYLDLQNAYNAENPEATQFDYRYRQSSPIRGVPILPTLGVKGTW